MDAAPGRERCLAGRPRSSPPRPRTGSAPRAGPRAARRPSAMATDRDGGPSGGLPRTRARPIVDAPPSTTRRAAMDPTISPIEPGTMTMATTASGAATHDPDHDGGQHVRGHGELAVGDGHEPGDPQASTTANGSSATSRTTRIRSATPGRPRGGPECRPDGRGDLLVRRDDPDDLRLERRRQTSLR